jgi:hypothetical protein
VLTFCGWEACWLTVPCCVVLRCAMLPCFGCCLVAAIRYGLVYAGIGWVCWRTPEDVPDEVGLTCMHHRCEASGQQPIMTAFAVTPS